MPELDIGVSSSPERRKLLDARLPSSRFLQLILPAPGKGICVAKHICMLGKQSVECGYERWMLDNIAFVARLLLVIVPLGLQVFIYQSHSPFLAVS